MLVSRRTHKFREFLLSFLLWQFLECFPFRTRHCTLCIPLNPEAVEVCFLECSATFKPSPKPWANAAPAAPAAVDCVAGLYGFGADGLCMASLAASKHPLTSSSNIDAETPAVWA